MSFDTFLKNSQHTSLFFSPFPVHSVDYFPVTQELQQAAFLSQAVPTPPALQI